MRSMSVIRVFFYGMLSLMFIQGLIVPQEATAASVWVAVDGDDQSGNGTSATPYRTISFALGFVGAGDTLQIKGGVYSESILIENKPAFVFRGASAVDTVYIISNQTGPVITYRPGAASAGRAMVFENLVLSHSDVSITGVGMLVDQATPILRNIVFRDNANDAPGGGLQINNNSLNRPLIENCRFTNNNAPQGAGLYSLSALEMRYTQFRNNTAGVSGGAAYFEKSAGLKIYNNHFYNNVADSGGAVYVSAKGTLGINQNIFTANFFTNNKSNKSGGALYYTGKDVISSVVESNTFAENHSDVDAGAIYVKNTSAILFKENTIVSNTSQGDGGAFYFKNVTQNTVNLWSNSITSNKAMGRGGAIYVDNVDQLSVGDAYSQRNNLFHNRDASQINNITSRTAISTLSLAHNYWGTTDPSSIINTLDIPSINTSWNTFDTTPADTRIKLSDVSSKIWFPDGYLDYSLAGQGAGITPAADSTVIIQTYPDTSFNVEGADLTLPKMYNFNWQTNLLPQVPGRLTFILDSAELNYLGNPFPSAIKAFHYSGGQWNMLETTVSDQGKIIQVNYSDAQQTTFTVGVVNGGVNARLYVLPRPEATQVSNRPLVSVQFQDTLNLNSINNTTVRLYGSLSGVHAAQLDFDQATHTLYMQPDVAFLSGEDVRVTLTNQLQLKDGSPFEGYSWHFRVAALRGSASLITTGNGSMFASGNENLKSMFVDFNGDGIPEWVQLTAGNLNVLAYVDGAYQLLHQQSINGYVTMAPADVDNDGRPEIVLFDDISIVIQPYSITDGFGAVTNLNVNTGALLQDARVVDLNNDGVMDMALLRDYGTSYSVDVYPGQLATGYSLANPITNFISGFPSWLEVIDTNDDGLPDLLINNVSTASSVSYLINNNGSFSLSETSIEYFEMQSHLLVSNVWQAGGTDEKEEVLVSGTTAVLKNGVPERLDVYERGVDNILNIVATQPFNNLIDDLQSADINSDGYPDILVLTVDSTLNVWYSEAGTLGTQVQQIDVGFGANNLVVADYDGDGDEDVLVSGPDNSTLSWQILENQTRAPRAWWVDAGEPNGNGDGSMAAPFQTIHEAVQHSFEGDSIYVRGGTPYREMVSVAGAIGLYAWDTARVELLPDQNNPFATAQIKVQNGARVTLQDFRMDNDLALSGLNGLEALSIDSLIVDNMDITGYDTGMRMQNSVARMNGIHLENNNFGMQADSLNLTLVRATVAGSQNSGLKFQNSDIDLQEVDILNNAQNGTVTDGGLWLENGSSALLNTVRVISNRKVNIRLKSSALEGRFLYIGESGAGENGLLATGASEVTLTNSVVADNADTGLKLSNSSGTLLNCVFTGNDSLGTNGGGAVILLNNSDGNIRNTIFIRNNLAIDATNGSATIRYNDFYANNQDVVGATPGVGNLQVDPLFVSEYNPLGATHFDTFGKFKLAPGSALLDQGVPSIQNEGTLSRSDIGLYGNLAFPWMVADLPQLNLTQGDSSVTLTWDAPSGEADALWAGQVVLRSTETAFTPDTSHIVAVIHKDSLSYTDRNMVFGQDYHYRLAFLDTLGATMGYSPAISGRIDFGAFAIPNANVNVQLGQGDTLLRPLTVRNTGTVPVTLTATQPDVAWLTITPDTLALDVAETAAFQLRFDASGLAKDSLYSTEVSLQIRDDALSLQTVPVRMLVSYRDLMRPRTLLTGQYPDTLFQSGITIAFSGDDTSNSSIGTPSRLLRYAYALMRNGKEEVARDTTENQYVSFYNLSAGIYQFQVAAIDTADNGGLGINDQKLTFIVVPRPFIIRAKRWQLVSVPFRITADSDLDTDALLAVKHWNETKYIDVAPDSLRPGNSYWVVSNKRMVAHPDDYEKFSVDTSLTLSLNEGWNMIGSAWDWDISLNDFRFLNGTQTLDFNQAVSDSLINGTLFYFNNKSKETEPYLTLQNESLERHNGYWLYAYRANKLSVSPTPYTGVETENLGKSAEQLVTENDAVLELQAQSGAETSHIYLSVLDDANRFPFIYRGAIEPPAVEKHLHVFTRKQGLNHVSDYINSRHLDSTQVWDVMLEPSDATGEINLLWNLYRKGEAIHYYIYHLETGEWFNVSRRTDYTIAPTGKTQHFKIYATRDASFAPRVLPTRFSLGQNYPNPFNPTTTIRIDVPFFADKTRARLVVYDILGREVKELFSGLLTSGNMVLTWDGKNGSGKQVASGIYFYRFEAEDFIASKKMILIR
ncbi:MAG: T9SS C-terminal target domain-containing protein [Calditrichaeota bacterium]|nr:MAG: T9SS C-terminal target domain-containing protein [Calditrichota bacterium]